MSPTKIEWTDETWSPVTGCDRVSAGCDNCYAMATMSGDRTLPLLALRVVRDFIWMGLGMVVIREPWWWWIAGVVGVVATAALGVWRDGMLTEEAQAREREWWQRANR